MSEDVVKKAVLGVAEILEKENQEWLSFALVSNGLYTEETTPEEILDLQNRLKIIYFEGNPFPDHIELDGKPLKPDFELYREIMEEIKAYKEAQNETE